MSKFFDNLYSSAYGRLARRIVMMGVVAAFVVLLGKIDLAPDKIFDSIVSLPKSEWIYLLKIFIGTGILAGIDKAKRELVGQ